MPRDVATAAEPATKPEDRVVKKTPCEGLILEELPRELLDAVQTLREAVEENAEEVKEVRQCSGGDVLISFL